jgi:hypothetical protein
LSISHEIINRNAALDRQQAAGKANRWRFLCAILPHRWNYTHLFDEEPDYPDTRGSSHYAGVCSRCGARDLFSGPFRLHQDDSA